MSYWIIDSCYRLFFLSSRKSCFVPYLREWFYGRDCEFCFSRKPADCTEVYRLSREAVAAAACGSVRIRADLLFVVTVKETSVVAVCEL